MPRPPSAPMIECEFCHELITDSSYWRLLIQDRHVTGVAHDGCHVALVAVYRLALSAKVSFWRVADRSVDNRLS